jgi:spore coat protein H
MSTSLYGLLISFGINLLVALVLVRGIYYPVSRDRSYVFTFLAFNTIIFFVLSLLSSTELSVGIGFGLFAIFSVLRYRTDPMPIREMTYMFAIMALPTMNAMLLNTAMYTQLLIANVAVPAILYFLEQGWGFRYEKRREFIYDHMKLLKPENEELLLLDLQERTGLPVCRVEIGKTDLVKKRAQLTLFYAEESRTVLAAAANRKRHRHTRPHRQYKRGIMMNNSQTFLTLIALLLIFLLGCSENGTIEDKGNTTEAVVVETISESAASLTAASAAEKVVDDVGTDTRVETAVSATDPTHGKLDTPNYDVVFPDDQVNTITITIDPENWAAMLAEMTATYGAAGSGGQMGPGTGPGEGPGTSRPPGNGGPPAAPGNSPGGPGQQALILSDNDPSFVPATVSFNDETWTYVGVRFKGNSSLISTWSSGNQKFSFKLDFDEFEDTYPETEDQRFYGFKQLNLNNNFGDSSFMHETLAADLFAAAGVPVAETAYVALYVDIGDGPVYYGLYTMVEELDDTGIDRLFGDDDGNLYKPDGATFAAGTFDTAQFEKKSNEEEPDWSDVQALYDVLHAGNRLTDPTAWRADLEAVFDVDGFLTWLAVNGTMQNWDTYGSMSHNFYLYNDPESGLLTWIPWDNNEALQDGRARGAATASLALSEVGDDWPLISFLLADEVYNAQYVEAVATFSSEIFTTAALEEAVAAYAELITPYVAMEQAGYTFLSGNETFDSALTTLLTHVAARETAVAQFLQ